MGLFLTLSAQLDDIFWSPLIFELQKATENKILEMSIIISPLESETRQDHTEKKKQTLKKNNKKVIWALFRRVKNNKLTACVFKAVYSVGQKANTTQESSSLFFMNLLVIPHANSDRVGFSNVSKEKRDKEMLYDQSH